MSSAKILTVGLLCVLVLVVQGFAATEAGDMEVGGQISLTIPDEGDESLMAMGNVGLFLTDIWQLSSRVIFVKFGDNEYGYVLGGLDYYFPGDTEYLPYVGGGIGISIMQDETDLGLDGHAGVKQFVLENVSVNYELSYTTRAEDIGAGDIVLSVGLSTYF